MRKPWVRKNDARKRIRGLRRHYRNLRQLSEYPGELRTVNLNWLTRFQQTYLNPRPDPWASYQAVPHPQEFRAIWVRHLLLTFSSWRVWAQARYSAFYLAVWLPEPDKFIGARLMLAVNERRLFYENRFGSAQEKPFPAEYATIPGIQSLNWQAYLQLFRRTPEEFKEQEAELSHFPHRWCTDEQGDSYVELQAGWMWVGQ